MKPMDSLRQQANQQFAQNQGQQQAQLQSQLGGAPSQMGDISKVSQQVAGEQARQTGQAAVQAQAGAQAQGNMRNQIALQQRSREIQDRVADISIQRTKKQQELETRFAKLGEEKKSQLFDEQMKIRRDANGRAVLTERQLLDYAITSAQNEQSYLNWASDVKIASDREIQLWETSYKKLEVAATQAFKTAESQKDREHAKNLQDMARKAQEEQRKAEARARNRMAKYQAAGTIVGVAAAAAVLMIPGVGIAAAPGIIAAGATLGQAGGTTAAAQ